MLVVSRKRDQATVVQLSRLIPLIEKDPAKLARILSGDITVMICDTKLGKVRVGFECDDAIEIYRTELLEKINAKA